MTTRDERVVSTDPGAAEDARGSGGPAWGRRSLEFRFASDLEFGAVER
jgi:hypothetical protein